MSLIGRRTVVVYMFVILIFLAYTPYLALHEQGVFSEREMEVFSAGFTVALILAIYLTLQTIDDALSRLLGQRYGLIVASGGGTVLYLAIAVQQLVVGGKLAVGVASWAVLFSVIMSSDFWAEKVTEWVNTLRSEGST